MRAPGLILQPADIFKVITEFRISQRFIATFGYLAFFKIVTYMPSSTLLVIVNIFLFTASVFSQVIIEQFTPRNLKFKI